MTEEHQEMKNAKDVMQRFLTAQTTGQYVQWKPYFSRISLAGFTDQQGALRQTPIEFFSGVVGSTGQQGFERQLTDADTCMNSGGENAMPAGREFIGYTMGIALNPEAPPWIKEAIAYYATISQKRQNTIYEFGQAGHWPAPQYGIQARAASTTVANSTINQSTIGGGEAERRLQEGSYLVFPAKQPIGLRLTPSKQNTYITSNGARVGVGGAVKINNNGDSGIFDGSAPWQPNPAREACALVQVIVFGYEFSLPG